MDKTVELILDYLKITWGLSVEWAEGQIKTYEGASPSYLRNEIIKCRQDYRNCDFGNTYIDAGMFELNDKKLELEMLAFYLYRYGKLIEQQLKQGVDVDGSEIKELATLGDDAEIFLRNYLLIRLLSRKLGEGNTKEPKDIGDSKPAKLLECSEWLKHQFYDKVGRLSFFLERCEGKKNSDIVKEVQGAMAAQFVRFKNTEYDRTRYKQIFGELNKLFPDKIYSDSAWNSCMNYRHDSEIPSIADEYKKYMESETD